MASPTIAIIEDDLGLIQMLELLLSEEGYRVITCTNGQKAHALIRQTLPDIILLDLRLETPDAGGMVLGLLELDPMTQQIPVIVCSADTQALRRWSLLLQERKYTVLEKPVQPVLLLETIGDVLSRSKARA
ncbi:MAG: response regulator [Chloroflexi bacterium]|nr:response regulator [Chloroflexota bacterium]